MVHIHRFGALLTVWYKTPLGVPDKRNEYKILSNYQTSNFRLKPFFFSTDLTHSPWDGFGALGRQGPCLPGGGILGLDRLKVCETFASFTELNEAAKDLLLGRDTKARRDAPIFRRLLNLKSLATTQREPKLNFALACWLQDW